MEEFLLVDGDIMADQSNWVDPVLYERYTKNLLLVIVAYAEASIRAGQVGRGDWAFSDGQVRNLPDGMAEKVEAQVLEVRPTGWRKMFRDTETYRLKYDEERGNFRVI